MPSFQRRTCVLLFIDTGGFETGTDPESVEGAVQAQADLAVNEATVILVLLDARQGLTPDDEELVRTIRRRTTGASAFCGEQG